MKYYLHDANSFNDEKVTELFIKFGYEGLGLFYTILEKLSQQEKPIKTDVLKRQLRVGKHLNKCWEFMESLGIVSSNNGDTFNERLLNYAGKYKIKSEKNAERVANWRAKQEDVTHYESVRNARKVKESKVKESKVNIISEQSSQAVQEMMKIFYEINPMIKFGHKGERSAAQRMVDKLGVEKALGSARSAIAIYGKPFSPMITTPIQLENKLSELVAFFQKQQANIMTVDLDSIK